LTIRPLAWALALALALPVTAADSPWTTRDTLWESAFMAVLALDCSQSRKIENPGNPVFEADRLLPAKPRARTILGMSAATALGHAGISCLLPSPWRRRWQVVTLSVEAWVVEDNYFRVGMKFSF